MDELTRREELRWILLSQFMFRLIEFLTMGKKTKGKIAKPREPSRREQGNTARAGEGDERLQVNSMKTHSMQV